MKSEWNTSAIANICKVVTDGSHTSPKSVSHGKYMVSVKDFTPYGFDFNGCRQISFADYEKLKSSGCVPQKGDILIGKDGARYFEDIIIYNQDEAPALLSSIAILRCDEEKVIPEYLYYLLKTPSFKKDVKDNYGSGSAIPRIILKDFKRMKVKYPSIEKQRQIVSILHDLDAKIFNNQKVNDNLEQQAVALFKSWFVDFSLFGGTVPENWEDTTLENITTLITRGIAPKYSDNSDQTVVNQKCIRNHTIDLSLARTHTPKAINEKWLKFGDLLINSTGDGTLGRVAQVWFAPKALTVDSHVTIVRPAREELIFYIGLWGILHEKEIESLHTGSTGQTELPRDQVKMLKLLLPDNISLSRFNSIITPMASTIISNQEENQKLASLRDTLLPKLMSGEIDVSNIQF